MADRKKHIPKPTDIRKRDTGKPVTSIEDFNARRERRKKISKDNRNRSKAMERNTSKLLNGERTPQSGAGLSKGDVRVNFTYRPGHYMIECKLSAGINYDQPYIVIQKRWMDKMKEEAEKMRSLFPILLIKFHYKQEQFVFILPEDLSKIYTIEEEIGIIDKSERKRMGVGVYHTELVKSLKKYRFTIFKFPYRDYIFMSLQTWREIIGEI